MIFDDKIGERSFWQLPKQDAFRRGPWKYVRSAKEEMLFNLDNNPAETKNLAKEKPELLQELKTAHTAVSALSNSSRYFCASFAQVSFNMILRFKANLPVVLSLSKAI